MLKHATGMFLRKDNTLAFLLRCPAYSLLPVWLRHLPTAATHSPRFFCHWQRSARSPGKPGNENTKPHYFGSEVFYVV